MSKIRFTPDEPTSDKGGSKVRFEPDQVEPFLGERADAAQAGQNFDSSVLAPLDIVSSAMREGVNEFLKEAEIVPDFKTLNPIDQVTKNAKAARSGGRAALTRLLKNLQHPFSSPQEAPTSSDIVRRELDESPVMSSILNDKEKGIAAGITGFAADIAMPSGEAAAIQAGAKATGMGSKLKEGLKTVTGALKNVERKQFAKVLAKFETMAQYKGSKIDQDTLAAVLVDQELASIVATIGNSMVYNVSNDLMIMPKFAT